MRARQIDQFDQYIVNFDVADMAFDRDTRVIADALPEPGQSIKECAFAGVRTTDNRNAGIRLPAYGYLVYGDSNWFASHQPIRERR